MLIVAIQAEDAHEAFVQIKAVYDQADGFELRLDYWTLIDFAALKNLRQHCAKPLIFTLRRQDQGGKFKGTEAQRLEKILALCAVGPDYFDLEYDVAPDFIALLKQSFPQIQLIVSYHDFDKTPQDLSVILAKMQQPFTVIYKLATMAHSTIDALRMLVFIKNAQVPFAGMCMGEQGELTRVLGPVVGNALDYASASKEQATAPGQILVQDLHGVYHYHLLNQETKIYGVLGDPVTKSVGYRVHNQAIRLLKQNAVYVRLKVSIAELSMALALCRELPFAGASVTMPLKEAVMQYLDRVDVTAQKIKAVNTILVNEQCWQGFNTDGAGAIAALEVRGSIKNKKIVILGAGGAAKAIAFVALQHGAKVLVLNRTQARAEQLAHDLGCDAGALKALHALPHYDALINTLPVGDDIANLIAPKDLQAGTLAMDIVYQPLKTKFLQIAEAAGCVLISGYEMYIEQALLQEQYWFGLDADSLFAVRNVMEKYFLNN